jgi:NADH-quinone oxidoreductase subunit H
MASWFRWLAPVVLALVVAGLAGSEGACRGEPSPELVQVLDMTPREVELGERVSFIGDGFPPGKLARLTFRGTLHRPGERAETEADIVATGIVSGPGRVQVAFTESTLALFCGVGERAAHTSFEGEVEVAFAAAIAGAPPVVGVLRHATLDLHPSATPSDWERDQEGARLLAWLGVRAVPAPATGLAVDAVAPGSRADAAGIVAGDLLASFDGVRVGSLGDVVPAPGARESVVGVRRSGDRSEAMKTVSVEGFRRAPPVELLGASLLVLAAMAVVLLFAAPTVPSLAALLQRVVGRLRVRAADAAGAMSRGPSLGALMFGTLRETLPRSAPAAVVDALVCAMLAAMPFGQYLVAAQLDVGVLFVAAATFLVVAALVGRASAWDGTMAALHVAWQHVPAAVAVATVVVTTGSLRIQEIERAQGGWPWEWLAFKSPMGLLSLGLCIACARIEPRAPRSGDTLATSIDVGRSPQGAAAQCDVGRSPQGAAAHSDGSRRWLLLDAACRAHRVVIAGLASALFLGGWRLPGVSPAVQEARPLLELLGAVGLLLKTWGVVLLLILAGRGLARPTLRERSRLAARWLAPLSVAALAASAGWAWWSVPAAVQTLLSAALGAVAALSTVALAHRVHYGLVAPGADARLSPFL